MYHTEDLAGADEDVVAKHAARHKDDPKFEDTISVVVDIFDSKGMRIERHQRTVIPSVNVTKATQDFLSNLYD